MEASTTLIVLGIIIIVAAFYLRAAIHHVPKPENWVIESNFPFRETTVKVWKPGLRFLSIPIPPLMVIRNKLSTAEEEINVTIGVKDENMGGAGLVDFVDVSAGVHIQLILKVIDPAKATYNIDNYKLAAVNRAEANFRKLLGKMKLDEAMQNADKRSNLTREVFDDVNEAINPWGVALLNPGNEITVLDFILDPKTIEQRDKIIAAEKDYEAKIKAAEATKRETVLHKEGEGKGQADEVMILAKELGISPQEAMEYLLKNKAIKSIEGSSIVATSEGGDLSYPIKVGGSLIALNESRKKDDKK